MRTNVGAVSTGDPSSGVLVGGLSTPIIVYGFYPAASDGLVTLKNGSGSGDLVYSATQPVAGNDYVEMWGFGIVFPNGCFYTNSAGSAADVVYYTKFPN